MKINKLFKILLIITSLLLVFSINVKATVVLSISNSSVTLNEGESKTVSVNGSNATGMLSFKSSNAEVATVSNASQWIENETITVSITAKKAGTANITISGTISDKDGNEEDISKTVSVTVKAKEVSTPKVEEKKTETTTPKTPSSNANLKSLGVTSKYDNFKFKNIQSTYDVTVPNNVDSLEVYAKAEDSNAKVTVTGNSGFSVGSDNNIKIVVTAEDGKTTKTYNIKVTKLAEEEQQPGNIIEEDISLYLTELSIKGFDLKPGFSKDFFSYSVSSEKKVENVEISTKANKDNVKVEISGNTGMSDGENKINIILSVEGNSKTVVYQILFNNPMQEVTETNAEISIESENKGLFDKVLDNVKLYAIIAISVVVFLIVSLIVLIILLKKENKKDNGEIKKNKIKKEKIVKEVEEKRNTTKERGRHSK